MKLWTFGILVALELTSSCHSSQGFARDLSLIREAQAKSVDGASPKWLDLSSQRDLFRRVRDRGYAYCLRGKTIEKNCASEQDAAVGAAIGAIFLAESQRDMRDKSGLTPKERALAFDPALLSRVLNTCWSLYKEHGAADARILSVCLGNLTDFSPLVPVPVP
jgi:hypothetical protein